MLESSNHQSIWNPFFFEQGGLFELFHPWSDWIVRHSEAFPSLSDLNELIGRSCVAPVVSGGGFPLKCVKQQRIGRAQRDQLGWLADYQLRIFFAGEVPTRSNNWHDFFNAWSWIHFPKTKAAINFRHFQCAEESLNFPWRRSGGNRNREQDLLTLFDEGGIIVVTSNDEIWELIKERRWQELFITRKKDLKENSVFLPIGHALYECALEKHPRLHASAVRVNIDSHKVRGSNGELNLKGLALADELAALVLSSRSLLKTPDDLHALPIWGLPGWHPQAGVEKFIADSSYFR